MLIVCLAAFRHVHPLDVFFEPLFFHVGLSQVYIVHLVVFFLSPVYICDSISDLFL